MLPTNTRPARTKGGDNQRAGVAQEKGGGGDNQRKGGGGDNRRAQALVAGLVGVLAQERGDRSEKRPNPSTNTSTNPYANPNPNPNPNSNPG